MRCLAEARVPVDVDAREYEASDPRADEELRSEYVPTASSTRARGRATRWRSPCPSRSCRSDCAGLCTVCGKDLNVEPHAHAEAAVDPRWAALEALRTEAGDCSREPARLVGRSGACP